MSVGRVTIHRDRAYCGDGGGARRPRAGVEDRQFTEHVGRAQDREKRRLAVRRPVADLDLAGNDDVQQVAGLTLGEHHVPAWEVGGLQVAGQRGHGVEFDSLEDSSPAEDFVHGWPHKLLSRMTRLFSRCRLSKPTQA
jgi:hypothetical protein